jgi:nucleoside phosphorylase
MLDVLVSTRIWNYEPGRITGEQFTPRGEELPASNLLLDACRQSMTDGDRIHFGVIASGEKLVDSEKFVETLRSTRSQIVGGEMEGSGISAVCQREKVEWILIKGICDWGDNKTKEFQEEAARRAASYCLRVVQYLGTVRSQASPY